MKPAAWVLVAVVGLGAVLAWRTLRGDAAAVPAALPSASIEPLRFTGASTSADDAFLLALGPSGGASAGAGTGGSSTDAGGEGSGSGSSGSASGGGVIVAVCGGGQILTPDGQCVADPGL